LRENSILFLTGDEVASLLKNREEEVLDIVKKVYEAHAQGEDVLPHSLFLRPCKSSSSRFIALPSYIGKGFELAGIKWVSSFPGNIQRGIERASAVTILNSIDTGRPLAVLLTS
jgi:N-[(2S)-2-amino-2-carboxyethyl]-L-glutamate dehydrogenase